MKNYSQQAVLFLIILSLFSFSASAFDQYLGRGQGAYLPTHTLSRNEGVWPTDGDIRSRTGNYEDEGTLLIQDFDLDGKAEIAVMNNDTIEFLNYTIGAGFALEGSVDIGTDVLPNDKDTAQSITYVNYGGAYKVVATNHSHMLLYQHDGSAATLNRSIANPLYKPAVGCIPLIRYHDITCAPSTAMADGHTHCFMLSEDPSGTHYLFLLDWDLDADMLNTTKILSTNQANVQPNTYNLFVANIDGASSDYELAFSYGSSSTKYIDVCQPGIAGSNTTCTQIYSHNLGGAHQLRSSDIVIGDMDGNAGNGLEITYLYTTSGTAWNARTLRYNGDVISTDYGANFPADSVSVNGIWTYPISVYDFCLTDYDVLFMTEYAGALETICLSQYYGADILRADRGEQNITGPYFIHENAMFSAGQSAIITDNFALRPSGPVNLSMPNCGFSITADYAGDGSLDIICLADGAVYYMDDGYTNALPDLTDRRVDTGNPVCADQLVRFSSVVDDPESDIIYCEFEELNASRSVNNSMSNQTGINASSGSQISFNHLTDSLGTFEMIFRCRDIYHDDFSEWTYTLIVSDSESCRIKGEDPVILDDVDDRKEAAQRDFEGDMDATWESIGAESQQERSIIWLITMVLFLGGAVFALSKTGLSGTGLVFSGAGLGVILILIGWMIGGLTAVPLVILGLFLALALTIGWFAGRGMSAGA